MGLFDSLGDHYSLKTALEAKCDLRFEISDLITYVTRVSRYIY